MPRISIVLLAITLCGAAPILSAQPNPPASPRPELFAQGRITTPFYELNAAFTPDGREVYFTRINPNWPAGTNYWVIVVSRLRGGRWTEPEVTSFSGQWDDADPFVSPDGQRLFFISNRPTSGDKARRDHDIWMVERRADGGWSEPRNLGPNVNSERNEWYPSVAANGTLYLSTVRADGRGNDLHRSRLVNGEYQPLEALPEPLNSRYSENDAFVAPDESYIVFTGYGRPDSFGNGDLYISRRTGDAWSEPRNLGPAINTVAREFTPIVHGGYLYFTSEIGFAAVPRTRPLTWPEFRERISGVMNGLGNVYRVPVSVLEAR